METSSKPIRFAELLEQHIVNQVNRKFATSGAMLNNDTLHQIRDLVTEQVSGVFRKSSHQVGNLALTWLSNQIFQTLQIGTTDGKKSIRELVIFNEYKLSEMPYSDLQLLRNLFNETTMGPELEEEYRKRSAV